MPKEIFRIRHRHFFLVILIYLHPVMTLFSRYNRNENEGGLIVPYGIEITEYCCTTYDNNGLIVPYGIEIFHYRLQVTVLDGLIVPYGIEIIYRRIILFRKSRFNRTLWN